MKCWRVYGREWYLHIVVIQLINRGHNHVGFIQWTNQWISNTLQPKDLWIIWSSMSRKAFAVYAMKLFITRIFSISTITEFTSGWMSMLFTGDMNEYDFPDLNNSGRSWPVYTILKVSFSCIMKAIFTISAVKSISVNMLGKSTLGASPLFKTGNWNLYSTIVANVYHISGKSGGGKSTICKQLFSQRMLAKYLFTTFFFPSTVRPAADRLLDIIEFGHHWIKTAKDNHYSPYICYQLGHCKLNTLLIHLFKLGKSLISCYIHQ